MTPNELLIQEMLVSKLDEMPGRKDPAQNPSVIFKAVQSMMMCSEMWDDFLAEYELRQFFYDSIKIPQNCMPQNGLTTRPQWFEMFCKVLLASQDDVAAAAVIRIVADYYGNHLIHEIDVMAERVEFNGDGSIKDDSWAESRRNQLIDNYACFLRDLFVYISEYIDKDLLIDATIQAIEGKTSPILSEIGLPLIVASITNGIINEWNSSNADQYTERTRLLASYKNRSGFYSCCKEAIQSFTGMKKAGGEIIALPKSDKRLGAILDIWTENHDYTNIVCAGEAEEEEDDKKPMTVGKYISMGVAMILSMEEDTLMPAYIMQMRDGVPKKLGKEIVNRAFLLAEQNGMETKNDLLITTQTKQFILSIIAEEIAREYMRRRAHELATALSDRSMRENTEHQEKGPETEEYAARRFEELLEENRRLKKKLEQKPSAKTDKKAVREEIKELKAALSEREKELQTLKEETESLRKENEEILTLFDLENDASEPLAVVEDEMEVEKAIGDKRILVWGCRADFIRKFEGRYPNVALMDTSSRKISKLTSAQLVNYDGVIVQTNCCSHGMYTGVVKSLRIADKPYVHMQKYDNSDAAFMQCIIMLCRKIEDENALKKGGDPA